MRPLLLFGRAVHGHHLSTFQFPAPQSSAEVTDVLKAFRCGPVGGVMPGNAMGAAAIDNDSHVFGIFKMGFQAGFVIEGNGAWDMSAGVSFRAVGINQQHFTGGQLLSQFLVGHIRILLLILGQCGDGLFFAVRAGRAVIRCCAFAGRQVGVDEQAEAAE